MTKVFNSVQTTNLSTTLANYSELQSNTFSMKLFGKNSASTTTSKIFKVIGLESIANSSDGVNYFLKAETIINEDESLTLPDGIVFNVNYNLTNKGNVVIGDKTTFTVKNNNNTKLTDKSDADITTGELINSGGEIYNYGVMLIGPNAFFYNYENGVVNNYAVIENNGTFNCSVYNTGGGTIFNNISALILNGNTKQAGDGDLILWGYQGDSSTGLLNNGGGCVSNYGTINDCGAINNYTVYDNIYGVYVQADGQFNNYNSGSSCESVTSIYNQCV